MAGHVESNATYRSDSDSTADRLQKIHNGQSLILTKATIIETQDARLEAWIEEVNEQMNEIDLKVSKLQEIDDTLGKLNEEVNLHETLGNPDDLDKRSRQWNLILFGYDGLHTRESWQKSEKTIAEFCAKQPTNVG